MNFYAIMLIIVFSALVIASILPVIKITKNLDLEIPFDKVIKFETVYKKPQLVRVCQKLPADMFKGDLYEDAVEYVKKLLSVELGKYITENDLIYITESDDLCNQEKIFIASCFVMKE